MAEKIEVSTRQMQEYRKIFDLVDVDRGGSISPEELGQYMRILRLCSTKEELDAMIRDIDANQSGDIDFDEFVSVMSRKSTVDHSQEDVEAAFKSFQKEGNVDQISVDELRKALMSSGTEKLTQEQADELILQMGMETDGLVNYKDFLASIKIK